MCVDFCFAACRKRLTAVVAWAHLAVAFAAASLHAQDCPIVISHQPQSLLVLENCRATFDVGVTSATPVFYQWFRDGAPITGATNAIYTVEFVQLADNGAVFEVVVSTSSCSVTSSPAALNISTDVVPPRLTSASGGPTLDMVTVAFAGGICTGPAGFLDPMSAMDIFNYDLTGGLIVSNALLAPGGTNVILTTSPLSPGVEYTLYVEGVMDLAGNTIAQGSHVTFRAWTPPRVLIERVGANCVISWEPPTGTLEVSENIIGNWTQLPSAASPHPVPANESQRYYRIVIAP